MNQFRIKDEHGQVWDVTPEDDVLWREYWPQAKATPGATPMVVDIVPLAKILANRGWGWWSSFKSQDEWLRHCGIPVPDHNLPLNDPTMQGLSNLLQRYGGYVSWLEYQVGALDGRRLALKQAYEAAILTHTKDMDGKMSEKAKEAQVLGNKDNGTIRLTKQMLIDNEAVLGAAQGLLKSYQRAWETVSRIVTTRQAEAEATGGARRQA